MTLHWSDIHLERLRLGRELEAAVAHTRDCRERLNQAEERLQVLGQQQRLLTDYLRALRRQDPTDEALAAALAPPPGEQDF